MRALAYRDPREFATRAAGVLGRHATAYNVPATLLAERLAARTTGPDELWLLVLAGDEPVGAAMHTPPYNLFVGPVDGDIDCAATVLLESVASRELPGVTGERVLAEAFAAAWQRGTGGRTRETMSELMYQIDAPPPLPPVTGLVRAASDADLALLDTWLDAFHAEALPEQPWTGGEATVRRQLAGRTMLIWDDARGRPVGLAGLTRAAAGVARIGPVYTPPEHRGRGYASVLTAAAVARGFSAGASRVALYADAANATSNGVYRRLGFRPVGDAVMISFDSWWVSAGASPGRGR